MFWKCLIFCIEQMPVSLTSYISCSVCMLPKSNVTSHVMLDVFCLQDARVCVWGRSICSALSFCWSFPLFSCCIQEASFRTDPWLSWQDTPLPPVPTGRQWEVSHEMQELCVFVCMKWWRGFISGVDFPLGNCRFIPAERPSRLRARLVRAFNSWGWRHERDLTC